MSVEERSLKFSDEAIRALAHYQQVANEKTGESGGRRLHTVVEQVIEEISFEAENYKGQEVEITESLVKEKLETLVADSDVARYILQVVFWKVKQDLQRFQADQMQERAHF